MNSQQLHFGSVYLRRSAGSNKRRLFSLNAQQMQGDFPIVRPAKYLAH